MIDHTLRTHVSTGNALEHGPHVWSTFASDMCFPVGQWPAEIDTDLGNGQPFIYSTYTCSPAGDILYASYVQQLGCLTLRVFND